MIAAWPNSWYDRLCAIIECGCSQSELPARLKILQDAIVTTVTGSGSNIHDAYGTIGDTARRSSKLHNHLCDLLASQRNAPELAYLACALLDCCARANGKQFYRSVRQLENDTGGVVPTKHAGRYLAIIAEGYSGKKCIIPIFTCRKGKVGSGRATYFSLNPQYQYLLNMT